MAESHYICPQCGHRQEKAPRRMAPPVTVLLEPEGKTVQLGRVKTAGRVLAALDLRPCMALVIRNGELLTPDRAIAPGETIRVRPVMSAG